MKRTMNNPLFKDALVYYLLIKVTFHNYVKKGLMEISFAKIVRINTATDRNINDPRNPTRLLNLPGYSYLVRKFDVSPQDIKMKLIYYT